MAAERLTDDEVEAALGSLSGWVRDGDHLRVEFVFPDFRAAMAFMVEVADEAERLNHHPEWANVYNRVNVGLTTHDVGGLSGNDVELATAMSAAASRHGAS